ncbi:S-adenosyl-L-methionine-dependent methyltransferase [Xylaria curta]|nr:S-adenosyl-L-methionine-dependent methyltransferase [Xylaria curta]
MLIIMDEVFAKIELLAKSRSYLSRQDIMASLHKLAYSMESPEDTRDRYSFLHLQTAVVKVGFDLRLFKHLAESTNALSADEIARKVGAQKELMERILRHLASFNAIEEVGKQQFTANRVTKNLAQRSAEAGICHWFGSASPQFQQVPALLKNTGYLNPVDETHTAFHEAWNTSLNPFAWFENQPVLQNYFNQYMATRARPEDSWLQVYPVLKETAGCPPERPLFVNIGGGVGHQCAQFKEKYPELLGRVVVQDLPYSIAEALPTPGVEAMIHDFFEPQPIRGAKIYYLRSVLHDHPNHKVSRIIQNIKAVMAPDSILLVDEIILPETRVNTVIASIDMCMLATFASMERTETQWRDMFHEEGLDLANTYVYNPFTYEGVLDVRLSPVDSNLDYDRAI